MMMRATQHSVQTMTADSEDIDLRHPSGPLIYGVIEVMVLIVVYLYSDLNSFSGAGLFVLALFATGIISAFNCLWALWNTVSVRARTLKIWNGVAAILHGTASIAIFLIFCELSDSGRLLRRRALSDGKSVPEFAAPPDDGNMGGACAFGLTYFLDSSQRAGPDTHG
ncbi:hypothetical protein [Paraburkholderia tagetis]|uniref:Uncharacterized protein n=1 Tax=Paraburkholderia tagetis TaxID=2913261 RepID=A0A9X1RS51_9BURK|nr:hypothetical protein [Paraburkholderia tagetis]MCG5074931.1 hypothetical protein [Paraburkholderia tagetis]